jgi:hypothetical protein
LIGDFAVEFFRKRDIHLNAMAILELIPGMMELLDFNDKFHIVRREK